MSDGYVSYKQAVGRSLPCGKQTRKALLDRFEAYHRSALEDVQSPTYEQMVNNFGPPEEFAAVLMQEVPPEQRQAYDRNRRVGLLCRKALIALWIVFTFYTFFIKQIPVHIEVTETTHTYEISPQEVMDGYLK